jgi:hydroxylamine reductase (hybrid-cluster protein)
MNLYWFPVVSHSRSHACMQWSGKVSCGKEGNMEDQNQIVIFSIPATCILLCLAGILLSTTSHKPNIICKLIFVTILLVKKW